MTGYTETILRYASDNRFSGELPDADGVGEVGLGEGEAGRRIGVRFALRIEGRRVSEARFQVFGCGFSVAACAAAAELTTNRSVEEALTIDASRVDALLQGLPEERSYCADLAVEALQAALASALNGSGTVHQNFQPRMADHGPRVNKEDPLYRALMDGPAPPGAREEDRHLFACLLAVAATEPFDTAEALGLSPEDLNGLLRDWFPAADRNLLQGCPPSTRQSPPEVNPEVLAILLSHVPSDAGGCPRADARRLSHILAARAAHPGHLWVAMGLFERPELSAAIRRHLPSLADANSQNMRWKRYLFKQVCDLNGGVMCKSPNCGDCADYPLCFPESE
ncbi:MAG: nitrogen fixation protein NifQ [Syntrophotaleaceae bacterium]